MKGGNKSKHCFGDFFGISGLEIWCCFCCFIFVGPFLPSFRGRGWTEVGLMAMRDDGVRGVRLLQQEGSSEASPFSRKTTTTRRRRVGPSCCDSGGGGSLPLRLLLERRLNAEQSCLQPFFHCCIVVV